jgi:fructose-1,6-bisphosphatase/inositol monophosphatase family enzyme
MLRVWGIFAILEWLQIETFINPEADKGNRMVGENKEFRQDTLAFFLGHAPVMGKIAMGHFGHLKPGDIELKEGHEHDLVTIADKEISRYIGSMIKKFYPGGLAVLTEETSKEFRADKLRTSRKPLMIVDELDGTVNFSNGNPEFSMLMALAEPGERGYEVTVGLVYKPFTEDFYYAVIGEDAVHCDADGGLTKLCVSENDVMLPGETPAGIAAGRETFPIDYPADYIRVTEVMERFRRVNLQVDEHSKFSCGLEMVAVAKGVTDVYMCAKAADWDFAAASLILKQAGGKAYLAKSVDMMMRFQPLKLQLDEQFYYPAFFTNGSIDKSLQAYLTSLRD